METNTGLKECLNCQKKKSLVFSKPENENCWWYNEEFDSFYCKDCELW
jgi:hypothetical protein